MANLEDLLDNGPSIADLSNVIAFQREEIQRLENVLQYYKQELAKLGWQGVEVPK